MAANESVNNDLISVESVVNRWVANYYLSLAVEFFKNKQYTDFNAISRVLDDVFGRRVEPSEDFPLKYRLFQFLSFIRDADEHLDQPFECDQKKTPLESALHLLEMMTKRFSLSQSDCGNVFTSLKEMIVGTFIKNDQFEKAKEALNQYFPSSATGKRTTFMNLIRQKKKAHKVIEQMNFQSFREEMLGFCQRLWSFPDPFLYKAAKNLVDKRLLEPDDITLEIDEQDDPSSSCSLPKNTVLLKFRKPAVIQRVRLEIACSSLAEGSCGKTFSQLTQEVETEAQEKEVSLELVADLTGDTDEDADQNQLFQRDSCSPMEASPADQPPQADTDPPTLTGSLSLYMVSRLVIEPDSQPSSGAGLKQTPPTVASSNGLKTVLCPVTDKEVIVPAERSADHDEVESAPSDAEDDDRPRKSTRKSRKLVFTSSESENELEKQPTPCTTREQRPPDSLSSSSPSKRVNPDDIEDYHISDSSLDSSPSGSFCPPVAMHSSNPRMVSRASGSLRRKWNEMVKNAKETKDVWSDEDSYFSSSTNTNLNESTSLNSGSKKRKWTESETQKLKNGVKTFGEGNWNKILTHYSFENRTNVNLKDRWRTMKKLNMV